MLLILIVSLTLKVLCHSPAVSSAEEHSSETQMLQISMGHRYLAPSWDLCPCWKLTAMAPSLCSAICHPKAPRGHCLLRYRDLSWSFQLFPDSRELVIDKGNHQLHFLVSSAGNGGPGEDTDWGFINPNGRTKGSSILHISLRVFWGAPQLLLAAQDVEALARPWAHSPEGLQWDQSSLQPEAAGPGAA